ncbi:MAG: aminotransferase class V-fold PLP-dependent enzyme [Acidobacteria bacterium]|nr:aminotransferase class V-fold PLP-dependent enzyme [Acidobacteriota bacterium]
MSMIYFDNNATTAVAPEVFEAMIPFLTGSFGNPSSGHAAGRAARRIVESSREEVASLIGAASSDEIVFTSGGTESDNWAILGALESLPEKRHIITTRVEHEAVRKLCELLSKKGYEISWLDVSGDGALDSDQLRRELRADTAIVSVMLANNETGILFPVADLAEIVKANSAALFHVDGVNAVGKVAIDLKRTAIDLFALSGHKFHAPKGIGALYIKNGVDLAPRSIGGGQERGRRAGTEAVHQIAGLGKAAEFAADLSKMDRVREIRDRLENEILQKIPNSRLNGTTDRSLRLPNTSNISFEGINGEMIVARLDAAGVAVSTGSACNSETHTASPVMQAMNIPYGQAMGSIRFSLGRYNTEAEVGFAIEKLLQIVAELRSVAGVS